MHDRYAATLKIVAPCSSPRITVVPSEDVLRAPAVRRQLQTMGVATLSKSYGIVVKQITPEIPYEKIQQSSDDKNKNT